MPDPREVAFVAEALERTDDAWQPRDINDENAPWGIDGDCSGLYEAQARAAIAADHQWLAEHAPAAMKQALDEFQRNVWFYGQDIGRYRDSDKKIEAAKAQWKPIIAASETALLALYQRPVIDEAAVERAVKALYDDMPDFISEGPIGSTRTRAMTYEEFIACKPQKHQEFKRRVTLGFSAALEAFVAGGEG